MEKIIRQDGKEYRFRPGKNGSLTVTPQGQMPSQGFDFNRPKGKVVPAISPKVRSKRMGIQRALVGSARG